MFGEEINFELSLTELVGFKLYVGCIYRAPNGQFDICLDKLEKMIKKLSSKNKILILCGDCNVDMLHESNNQSDLLGLLQRHNLINTIQSPTRITNNSNTLIWYKSPASVLELGLSDHLAQILSITSSKPIQTQMKSWRRNFNINNINKLSCYKSTEGQIPHANGSTHNCFAKSSGISAGPCTSARTQVLRCNYAEQ
jgi:hypothetical protein